VGANLKAAVPADVRVLAKPLSSGALAEALAPLAKDAASAADPDGVLQRSARPPSTMAHPPS